MEVFRDAAAEGARILRHEVTRAEDFGASPASPQETCLAGVRQSDVVILLVGERYGFIQPSGLSATHEEYEEAKDRKDILIFVQEGVTREPRQNELLGEVQAWATGQYTDGFETADELRDKVTERLHSLELSRQAGVVDEPEIMERAMVLLPQNIHGLGGGASLLLAIAGGPKQQVLRPTELEDPDLAKDLMRESTYGQFAVLDPGEGTHPKLEGSVLSIEQANAYVRLSELGEVVIAQPATKSGPRRGFGDLPALIEEDVLSKLETSLGLAGWILDRVDGPRRISDVVPVVAIEGGSYLAWKTRAEQSETPDVYSMNPTSDRAAVHLAPLTRKRAALTHDVARIGQDLVTLLRRQFR